jgi:hypothetical protein
MYRPACRMNQTGLTSVGRRRQASRKRLVIGATRMVNPDPATKTKLTQSVCFCGIFSTDDYYGIQLRRYFSLARIWNNHKDLQTNLYRW